MTNTYLEQYARYLDMVEKAIERVLPQTESDCPEDGKIPAKLCESMRYSLLAGGKRIRPVLLLAVSDMLGADLEEALVPAVALEMIHTYSLIHDDLPGMDDDDYRRGRLTNHKVYGVGPAILAGDGLLNYAYECLLSNAMCYPQTMDAHLRAAQVIAQRAGVSGMIAGQSIDLLSEHMEPDAERLAYIHMHKTADLLTAPLLAAAYIARADDQQIHALTQFGACVGLAFQIDDDLLDVEGNAQAMGKQTGMDVERGKMTWPALVGAKQAKTRSLELWTQAESALEIFGDKAWFLHAFTQQMRIRKH